MRWMWRRRTLKALLRAHIADITSVPIPGFDWPKETCPDCGQPLPDGCTCGGGQS